ncbi:MAG TPA: MASE1 domain-containing protein [Patescibacteria group bacterium]|nr:MASE1 domain-containing protein [Patescibacteria group bacterium]
MKRVQEQCFRIYRSTKILLLLMGITILYILAGKFGLSFAFDNPSASPIWAPTGIAIAAVIIFGKRVLPAIFLGAFLVNLTTAGTIFTSLSIAVGNTLEAALAAYLINRFAEGVSAFSRIANIFKFTLFILIATTISANIGVLTLVLANLASWDTFFSVWLTWWLGDVGGGLIVAPFILVWWIHPKLPIHIMHGLHFLLCLLGFYLVTEIIFQGIIPYPYLYIPLAIWVAFWFGRRGATTTTVIIALITITYTLSDKGPFIQDTLNASLVQLQIFLTTFSLSALIFSILILELRRGEKMIASHEQRFKTLIEKSSDAIFLVDATSKILYAGPSVKRLLGYEPSELEGTTGFNLVAPEDKKMTIRVLAEIVLKPGGAQTVEARLIRKDKRIIWVEATGTNLLLDSTINAVIVNFHDITEKKLSHDQMLTEKMEDEAMLTSIGEGILATDEAGKITMINQAACDNLGWHEKELIGKSVIETIPMVDDAGKRIPSEERPLTKVLTLKKKIVRSHGTNYMRKDGSVFPVHITINPITLDELTVGTIEVFYDITKEKEIDKAKSEFVSVASHQLRTPLATINWYLEELLRKGNNLDEKQKKYFNEVYLASKRMIALVNSLLNVSRIELGTFIVEPKPTDLGKLIDQIMKDLTSQTDKKNITIQKTYQPNLPLFSVDPKLFTIIMQNLLSNALKYSKIEGTIDVKIFYNNNEFLLSVSDNGYGIPKKQQDKIFTKLFRADNARTVAPEGSGLGLYIVKQIVNATGGKIWFTSTENKGTLFSVAFPIAGMQQKKGEKLLR